MNNTRQLIETLERIKPGLENSNSAAEDAMVEILPAVIRALRISLLDLFCSQIFDPTDGWLAIDHNTYCDGGPTGRGRTHDEAVDDLLDQLDQLDNA